MSVKFDKWVEENFNKVGKMYIQKDTTTPTLISYVNEKDLRELWEKIYIK